VFLQNLGKGHNLPFLYEQPAGTAPKVIRLHEVVAYCLHRFRPLITELVESGWTRWVQEQNLAIV
jgi:hypothetical protein